MDRSKLGRYEFVAGNSSKFWHIFQDLASGSFITEWGRIGSPPQGRKAGLSEGEARTKISEKISKGYRHVGGFKDTGRGNAPVAFGDEEDQVVTTVISKAKAINTTGLTPRKLKLKG